MEGYARVCSVGDIPGGSMREFSVSGKTVLLVSSGGAVYAVDPVCTHEDCAFGQTGAVDGDNLVCGCHGASFDLATGSVRSFPATVDLKTYPVEIRGQDVYVNLG